MTGGISPALDYLSAAQRIVERIQETQMPAIELAARICADTIASGGLVHLFGTGHSRIAVEEMFPRHGSFPGFHPIVELSLTYHNQVVGANGQRQTMFLEKLEGFGEVILRNFVFGPHDSLIVFSNSGINGVVIDVTLGAKARGLPVIAVVSLEHCLASPARHSSGKRLPDIADVTIDNCAPAGDALVHVPGLEYPVGPGSTVGYATVVNAIKCLVAADLTKRGRPPLVLTSSVLIGAEASAELFERTYDDYRARIAQVYGGGRTDEGRMTNEANRGGEPGGKSATEQLPLLPTSVIGSYAWPSWLHSALAAAQRDEYGPDDVQETLDDAVDLALRDQEDAGVDVVTDGEMRRAGFFTAAFFGCLTGIRELPPRRKAGVAGHDQRERYEVVESIAAPNGLGLVAEFAYARRRTTRPIKVPCPGPYTLAGRLTPGGVYRDRIEIAYALSEIVNRELKALVAARATFIQLDEPSYAVHPDTPREFVDLFNATIEGVGAKIGLHFCFGNYAGRPVARRTYRPLFPHILDVKADQLALEFANRELAELELWREFPSDKELAAGLVDVKNYYVETPEDVAQRIRVALRHVHPEKLTIVPDCGFSQTARWAARAKLMAMVEGTRIVRRELSGIPPHSPERKK